MIEKDLYHPIYPEINCYETERQRERPKPQDYDNIQEWQRAYDGWYRNQWGNCPNFAGHF